jgi:murein L,D-transpeptidase YafK
MKWFISFLFLLFFIFISSTVIKNDFLSGQKRFKKVQDALKEKEGFVKGKLNDHYISINDFDLLIVAYKEEKILDIYAKKKATDRYLKIHSYRICDVSGKLGPKRKRGDKQVPEGFYYIDAFNPTSQYHLSFRVSYPNKSDKIKSKYKDLGGDIYVHGSCATVGCLPMTDYYMDEIYIFTIYAKNNGQQKIPIYIFPFEMTNDRVKNYYTIYEKNTELISFWKNIKIGHDIFHLFQKELEISFSNNGDYIFKL